MYCLIRPCFKVTLSIVSKIRLKYICLCISLIMLLDYFGAFTHVFEIPYDDKFSYPYDGDIHEFTSALRHNEKPAVDPINEYNYSFILDNKQKCIEPGYKNFRIVFVVKSAIENGDRRLAIRNSWGFEKRFFDVPSRTVFLLGIHPRDEELQAKVKAEASKYRDIIQGDYIDNYYNNTIKTMMGFKWLMQYCSNSKFYMFVDDDMYVSVKNVLSFIRNPSNYPDYLKEPKKIGVRKREIEKSQLFQLLNTLNITDNAPATNTFDESTWNAEKGKKFLNNHFKASVPSHIITDSLALKISAITKDNVSKSTLKFMNKENDVVNMEKNYLKQLQKQITSSVTREKRQVFDFELPDDVKLFTGYVLVSSPHRHRSSKWYISLEEYAYHLWPPYVTAGAYILSKEAFIDLYYASFYTKHFKFDDIYLGLVAKKADIEPFHSEEFHFYKKDYTKFNYKYVITSHGYGDPNELLQVWNEQKALGNA